MLLRDESTRQSKACSAVCCLLVRPAAWRARAAQRHKAAQREEAAARLVVVVVVPVVGALAADVNVAQPLDHAAANPAGDEHSAWEAVVRVQELAVLLVRDQHVAAGVHCVRVRHVRAVRAVVALG